MIFGVRFEAHTTHVVPLTIQVKLREGMGQARLAAKAEWNNLKVILFIKTMKENIVTETFKAGRPIVLMLSLPRPPLCLVC